MFDGTEDTSTRGRNWLLQIPKALPTLKEKPTPLLSDGDLLVYNMIMKGGKILNIISWASQHRVCKCTGGCIAKAWLWHSLTTKESREW